MSNNQKTCSKCGRSLPLDQFNKHATTRDGLRPECKQCLSVIKKAYKSANKEKILAQTKAYYSKNRQLLLDKQKDYAQKHADKIKRRSKKWRKRNRPRLLDCKRADYQANKAKYSALGKVWNLANKEKINEYSRQFKQRHPERRRAIRWKYHSKIKGVVGVCTPDQWIAKCEFWGWRCYLCGVELTAKTMEMEHRKPIVRGGSHWPANLAPSCAPCNAQKGEMTESEYRVTISG